MGKACMCGGPCTGLSCYSLIFGKTRWSLVNLNSLLIYRVGCYKCLQLVGCIISYVAELSSPATMSGLQSFRLNIESIIVRESTVI